MDTVALCTPIVANGGGGRYCSFCCLCLSDIMEPLLLWFFWALLILGSSQFLVFFCCIDLISNGCSVGGSVVVFGSGKGKRGVSSTLVHSSRATSISVNVSVFSSGSVWMIFSFLLIRVLAIFFLFV